MIYRVYITNSPVPLTLRWESDEGGRIVLDNTADSSVPAKLLYPIHGAIYNTKQAEATFEAVVAHYEEDYPSAVQE